MNKETENFIAAELAAYHDNLRELELLREDIMEGSPGPPDGMPRGNTTSNPTADKAIRLVSSRVLLCVERRTAAITKVLRRNQNDPLMMELVRLSFFQRTHTPIGVCKELHISRRNYYRRRREFLGQIAEELGLK